MRTFRNSLHGISLRGIRHIDVTRHPSCEVVHSCAMARRSSSTNTPRTDPLSRLRTADMLKKLRMLKAEVRTLRASIGKAKTATVRRKRG